MFVSYIFTSLLGLAVRPRVFIWRIIYTFKEKSRRCQGVFNAKSRVKTWQAKFEESGLNNWSTSKSQKVGMEPGVRKGNAFPAGMPHPLQMLHGNHS